MNTLQEKIEKINSEITEIEKAVTNETNRLYDNNKNFKKQFDYLKSLREKLDNTSVDREECMLLVKAGLCLLKLYPSARGLFKLYSGAAKKYKELHKLNDQLLNKGEADPLKEIYGDDFSDYEFHPQMKKYKGVIDNLRKHEMNLTSSTNAVDIIKNFLRLIFWFMKNSSKIRDFEKLLTELHAEKLRKAA